MSADPCHCNAKLTDRPDQHGPICPVNPASPTHLPGIVPWKGDDEGSGA